MNPVSIQSNDNTTKGEQIGQRDESVGIGLIEKGYNSI